MNTTRHYTWGSGTRCGQHAFFCRVDELVLVTCGSCLRLIALDRIHDAETIIRIGIDEFLEIKRWAAKVNAARA